MAALTTSDPTTEQPPRPRRWIPLSLRLFAAILCGLGAWTGLRAYRQHAAIREIERLGGNVLTKPRGPDWLRHIAGDRVMRPFDRVIHVEAFHHEFTDERLEHLRLFPDLVGVNLHWSLVTDRVLDHLKDRTQLQFLELRGTRITDAGLEKLRGCTGLKYLDLGSTRVTDSGLAQLAQMKNLQYLILYDTLVTGSGCASLRGVTLTLLDLEGAATTPEGLASLGGLVGLHELRVGGQHVTDAHLRALAVPPSLKNLRVARANITDGGLAALRELRGLTVLTAEGTAQLKQALPGLNVVR